MPKSTEEIYKDLLAQGQGYQQQADSLLEQINNRPAFSYNADTDPMYQSIKNQYVHQGQRAMEDTMGKAAGLTGGYGSSYSQAVGNQAYNEYMTQLNAQIPVLAQQARQAYDAEGDALRDRYNLALNAANNAYNQGRDALADQRYEDELAWNRDWQQKQWDYNTQQQAQNDARSYAQYLLQMGIMPSDEQLAAAGISPQEAANIRNYYNAQMYAATAGSGSGGGRSGGSGGRGSSGGGYGYDYDHGNGDGSGSTESGNFWKNVQNAMGGVSGNVAGQLGQLGQALTGNAQIPQDGMVSIAKIYATKGKDAALDAFNEKYPQMIYGGNWKNAWDWIEKNWQNYKVTSPLAGYSRGERNFDFTT